MSELIPTTPVEYNKKRIVRYYGYKLCDFDAEGLLDTIGEMSLSEIPRIWQDGDITFYQYPWQPVIAIRNGELFTTSEVWQSEDFARAAEKL